MDEMTIRFWGVRGSIATPGERTLGVGGNTSCVEVRFGDTRLILDAGTGLRGLGDALMAEGQPVDATILLSHLHWDHIQGLPFFAPLYLGPTRLRFAGQGTRDRSLREALALQMREPTFPVAWEELPSHREYRELRHGQRFRQGEVEVRAAKLNHPGGGVFAFRLEAGGRSVVYATDTEHYACIDPTLARLAQGADVLIYDSQYTPEEYRGEVGMAKTGWGHSTFEAGAELAAAAGVGHLVLFHHDPGRDDAGVAAIEERARALFPSCEAAREGRAIHLPARGRRAA
ncbi:MAG TPA: MBL fold metallo-hydrolase [Polyangiaceae bacterium LLY-WYZ-15_(1-7)]|nr:MBL fold metallo-hydrolase [Polyangiaceae bacterium LLY-WYZ-15_(1-7)]HJL03475.1 MBL fold metallo-hydrolase [Polyangiaceae bacterium LLY-WYZ-15_(1-7)]HJL09590.1 MBL fold metallo-hydrolase [Polyangiaceae bacterium LLY-WYZ-15_(1-7)]HJL35655.1 MBL fold metallo-hydrolase [Polyangiaceae bacterium LLY-WYZ-15_(1-7)]